MASNQGEGGSEFGPLLRVPIGTHENRALPGNLCGDGAGLWDCRSLGTVRHRNHQHENRTEHDRERKSTLIPVKESL